MYTYTSTPNSLQSTDVSSQYSRGLSSRQKIRDDVMQEMRKKKPNTSSSTSLVPHNVYLLRNAPPPKPLRKNFDAVSYKKTKQRHPNTTDSYDNFGDSFNSQKVLSSKLESGVTGLCASGNVESTLSISSTEAGNGCSNSPVSLDRHIMLSPSTKSSEMMTFTEKMTMRNSCGQIIDSKSTFDLKCPIGQLTSCFKSQSGEHSNITTNDIFLSKNSGSVWQESELYTTGSMLPSIVPLKTFEPTDSLIVNDGKQDFSKNQVVESKELQSDQQNFASPLTSDKKVTDASNLKEFTSKQVTNLSDQFNVTRGKSNLTKNSPSKKHVEFLTETNEVEVIQEEIEVDGDVPPVNSFFQQQDSSISSKKEYTGVQAESVGESTEGYSFNVESISDAEVAQSSDDFLVDDQLNTAQHKVIQNSDSPISHFELMFPVVQESDTITFTFVEKSFSDLRSVGIPKEALIGRTQRFGEMEMIFPLVNNVGKFCFNIVKLNTSEKKVIGDNKKFNNINLISTVVKDARTVSVEDFDSETTKLENTTAKTDVRIATLTESNVNKKTNVGKKNDKKNHYELFETTITEEDEIVELYEEQVDDYKGHISTDNHDSNAMLLDQYTEETVVETIEETEVYDYYQDASSSKSHKDHQKSNNFTSKVNDKNVVHTATTSVMSSQLPTDLIFPVENEASSVRFYFSNSSCSSEFSETVKFSNNYCISSQSEILKNILHNENITLNTMCVENIGESNDNNIFCTINFFPPCVFYTLLKSIDLILNCCVNYFFTKTTNSAMIFTVFELNVPMMVQDVHQFILDTTCNLPQVHQMFAPVLFDDNHSICSQSYSFSNSPAVYSTLSSKDISDVDDDYAHLATILFAKSFYCELICSSEKYFVMFDVFNCALMISDATVFYKTYSEQQSGELLASKCSVTLGAPSLYVYQDANVHRLQKPSLPVRNLYVVSNGRKDVLSESILTLTSSESNSVWPNWKVWNSLESSSLL